MNVALPTDPVQWGVYVGLMVLGYILRHKGINVPFLPGPTPVNPAPAPGPSPAPDLGNHPVLAQALAQLQAMLKQLLQQQPKS